MKSVFAILFFGFLPWEMPGQASEKQHIFQERDTVELDDPHKARFTPSAKEVNLADSLAEIHIKSNRKDYVWAKEISNYKSYYRQYIGYLNEKNEKIIFINSFCRSAKGWTKHLVSASGGGSCRFNIKINLDTEDAFNLYVSAPK